MARIHVKAINERGEVFEQELEDYPAVVAQHECDHLDGVLYVDRALPQTLSFLKEYRRHQDELWAQITEEENI